MYKWDLRWDPAGQQKNQEREKKKSTHPTPPHTHSLHNWRTPPPPPSERKVLKDFDATAWPDQRQSADAAMLMAVGIDSCGMSLKTGLDGGCRNLVLVEKSCVTGYYRCTIAILLPSPGHGMATAFLGHLGSYLTRSLHYLKNQLGPTWDVARSDYRFLRHLSPCPSRSLSKVKIQPKPS